jgi:cell division protein FtsB
VARTTLLVVLLTVLFSFLGPATKYVRSWQLARETRSEVRQLRDDNAHLRRQAKLLKDPEQIELRARQLGMARPGERVYVVRGLPKAK